MNKILIYGSQYEHINRGLLDYLRNSYTFKDLQIILVVCRNSMSSCYINHRISNIEYGEHQNDMKSCNRCINNQRSFIDYKEEIDLNIRTVEIIDNPKIKKSTGEIQKFVASFSQIFDQVISEQDICLSDNLLKNFHTLDTLISIARSAIGEYVSSRGSTDTINWEIVANKIIEAQGIYSQINDLLIEENIDKVCVFNGRFMIASIIIEAAKQRGINYLSFESGHSWGPYASSYSIVENGRHQDFDARSSSLYNYYRRRELSKDYKRNEVILNGKKMLYDRIFKKKQTGNYKLFVTSEYNEKQKDNEDYILFLHTSLFEFFATDDYLKDQRSDQIAIISKLSEVIAETNKKLIIRFHPNSKNSDKIFKNKIIDVLIKKDVKFKVFHSEDLVDTYGLIMGATMVFGASTMGIVESIFCSRPSYYFSPAIYKCYLPSRYIDLNCEGWSNIIKEIISKPALISQEEIEQACLYYAEYNWLFENINYSNKGVEVQDLKIPSINQLNKYGHYTK